MRVGVLKLRFICVQIVIYAMFDCPRTVTHLLFTSIYRHFKGTWNFFTFHSCACAKHWQSKVFPKTALRKF